MYNNRIVHLVYRAFFLMFAFIGIIHSIIRFNIGEYDKYFLLNFANLSYYFCFSFMIVSYVETFKYVLKGEINGYSTILRPFRYITYIAILVSAIGYWSVMYPNQANTEFILSITNFFFFLICPLMLLFDFIFFDEHFTFKLSTLFYSLLYPLCYTVLILTLGALIPNFPYPFFFLDPRVVNYGGVFTWLSVFLFIYLVFLAFFYLWDKTYFNKEKKLKIAFKDKHEMREYLEG